MAKDVLDRRMDQALQSLEEARLFREERLGNLATLTKLYHAMIYGLLGLFGIDDIGTLTHRDLIDRFQREYVERGLFGQHYLDALNLAYDYSHECDCAHMKEPKDQDIDFLMPIAENFVAQLRQGQLSQG